MVWCSILMPSIGRSRREVGRHSALVFYTDAQYWQEQEGGRQTQWPGILY